VSGSPETELPGFVRPNGHRCFFATHSCRRRLEQIPGEIEAEQAAIRDRFADLQPRLFPVAVTFLVPERLDRK
jgi:hypothetical protein